MKSSGKRVGVLTGGGDVPPLNSVLKSVCESAEHYGVDVIGFWKGWEGLISEDGFVRLRSEMIDENRGGTFLKSSRVSLNKIEGGAEKALQRLNDLDIQTLIVIGGEDTLSNALLLDGFPQILISKTIDNDVGRIEDNKNKTFNIINYFTLGFPTALRKIVSYISWEEGLRTTAYSHERIIVVESMGMHAGWLASSSVLGKPDYIFIPEVPIDYESFIRSLVNLYTKQKQAIVVVAEGARWEDGSYISGDYSEIDDFGHPRFRGAARELYSRLKKDLASFFDTRNVNFVNPSYLYRSGAPCDMDKEWGWELGRKAVELLMDGMNDSIFLSIQRKDETFYIEPYPVKDIQSIEDFHRFVPKSFYNPETFSVTDDAVDYFRLFI